MDNTNGQPGVSPALAGAVVRHVTLPSGAEVVLRDPREMRARDKRYVVDHMRDDTSTRGRVLDVFDGTIAMLVEKWDVHYLPNAPLPRDHLPILDELTIPDYDKLQEVVGPAVELLFPTAKSEDAGTPGTPTPPANA